MKPPKRRRTLRKVAPVIALPRVDRAEDSLGHLTEMLTGGKVRGVIITCFEKRSAAVVQAYSMYCGDLDSIDALWAGYHIIREGAG